MVCGYCKQSGFRKYRALKRHWAETGCPTFRPVWARVLEARRAGHSGRRILHDAFPDLYQSEPMPEDVKEQLQELQERRRAQGVNLINKRKGKG